MHLKYNTKIYKATRKYKVPWLISFYHHADPRDIAQCSHEQTKLAISGTHSSFSMRRVLHLERVQRRQILDEELLTLLECRQLVFLHAYTCPVHKCKFVLGFVIQKFWLKLRLRPYHTVRYNLTARLNREFWRVTQAALHSIWWSLAYSEEKSRSYHNVKEVCCRW